MEPQNTLSTQTISVFCVFCGSISLAVERTPLHEPRVAPNPPEVILLQHGTATGVASLAMTACQLNRTCT